jgi:glucose/arabinose dehydrogenase
MLAPRVRGPAGLLLALLVLAACGAQSPSRGTRHAATTAPATPSPSSSLAPSGPVKLNVQTLVGGLNVPWDLAFLPDARMLVTERGGSVRVVSNGVLQPQPALRLPVKAAPGVESGLLGIALDPGYPGRPYVYLYYTRPGNTSRVSRFTVRQGGPAGLSLNDETVVLDNVPGGQCCHFGGRVRFGPDGDLYATVGDGQVPTRGLDTSSPNGKVLRIRPDGSIPPDNPFPGSPVYAYGLRNPQGLAWDPEGRLYVSDNGPTGEYGLYHHDEIDLVTKGAFYGWPLYASDVRTRQAAPANPPSAVPPVLDSGDATWAPSGIAFYAPRPNQQPSLMVAELTGQQVMRLGLDPSNPSHATSEDTALEGFGRMRAVAAGPGGCLYALTSNRDGRGNPASNDDRLLKACPAG